MHPKRSSELPIPERESLPGRSVRRRVRARDLIQRLHAKDTKHARHPTGTATRHCAGKPRRKRKAALALSMGVMSLGTAAAHAAPFHLTPIVQLAEVKKRKRASQMRVSDTLKEALIEEEGVRLTVYRDVAGNPTVGVGHLVDRDDGLHVGETVSYDEVLEFLEEDLRTAEMAVSRLVGDLPLYQHEFDALVDLVFNVGEGTVSPRKSPRLNAAIAAGDYETMATELDYTHAGGAKAGGLVHRSERRARMFMNASYENPRVAPAAQSEGARV